MLRPKEMIARYLERRRAMITSTSVAGAKMIHYYDDRDDDNGMTKDKVLAPTQKAKVKHESSNTNKDNEDDLNLVTELYRAFISRNQQSEVATTTANVESDNHQNLAKNEDSSSPGANNSAKGSPASSELVTTKEESTESKGTQTSLSYGYTAKLVVLEKIKRDVLFMGPAEFELFLTKLINYNKSILHHNYNNGQLTNTAINNNNNNIEHKKETNNEDKPKRSRGGRRSRATKARIIINQAALHHKHQQQKISVQVKPDIGTKELKEPLFKKEVLSLMDRTISPIPFEALIPVPASHQPVGVINRHPDEIIQQQQPQKSNKLCFRSPFRHCWNCKSREHTFPQCTEPKIVFCHKCGWEGVKTAECPAKHVATEAIVAMSPNCAIKNF